MNEVLCICTLPVLAALIAAFAPAEGMTRKIVPAFAWLEMLVIALICKGPLLDEAQTMVLTPELAVGHLGVMFMLLTCFVVASALTHADLFFAKEAVIDPEHGTQHVRAFYASAAFFLLAMIFLFMCDNIAYLWISIEATTLASTLLVYHNRTKHALEATWKYVIICSVGIAFALLGTILIFASSQYGGNQEGSLSLRVLMQDRNSLQFPLLRLGYIFCLLGYGTKAGIFPLHSWLPDAYSEAPAPASAMLSGSLVNCALFAIWRLTELVAQNGSSTVHMTLPLVLGTFTALIAAVFLVRQTGLKRLWAYSSIENVGIMLVAIGLGSGSLFFLQALNHSLAKVGLFLLSGNFIQVLNTKKLREMHGLMELAPVSSVLMALCALALTGAPPFGAFISEWLILMRSADLGFGWVTAALVAAFALAFVSVFVHLARIIFGTPRKGVAMDMPVRSAIIPAMLVIFALAAGITTAPALLVSLR